MSEMFWTTKKPDRPGFWQARVSRGSKRVVCEAMNNANGDPWTPNEFDRFKWWSSEPIPEPSEPTEHPDIQEIRAISRELDYQCRAQSLRLDALADKLQAALSGKDST